MAGCVVDLDIFPFGIWRASPGDVRYVIGPQLFIRRFRDVAAAGMDLQLRVHFQSMVDAWHSLRNTGFSQHNPFTSYPFLSVSFHPTAVTPVVLKKNLKTP